MLKGNASSSPFVVTRWLVAPPQHFHLAACGRPQDIYARAGLAVEGFSQPRHIETRNPSNERVGRSRQRHRHQIAGKEPVGLGIGGLAAPEQLVELGEGVGPAGLRIQTPANVRKRRTSVTSWNCLHGPRLPSTEAAQAPGLGCPHCFDECDRKESRARPCGGVHPYPDDG